MEAAQGGRLHLEPILGAEATRIPMIRSKNRKAHFS
jgi:hypothetical protein